MFAASPARADRCDDSAKELANNIDKMKVNFKAANTVYLTHPLARELSVACKGDKFSIELYGKGDRKPSQDFINLMGAMAAIVFTVTKDDTTTGASRCLKRMGLFARRQDRHALPPAQPGMPAQQDRGLDRDHPRQGRVAGATRRAIGPLVTNSLAIHRDAEFILKGSLETFDRQIAAA